MKDNTVYLNHILDAIEKIESYLNDISFELFSKNDMVIDAVVRELEIIGEAANNLSEDLKSKYPNIPFRRMTDMRNVLAHEYFGINTKVVWDTCKKNLPELKEVIGTSLE